MEFHPSRKSPWCNIKLKDMVLRRCELSDEQILLALNQTSNREHVLYRFKSSFPVVEALHKTKLNTDQAENLARSHLDARSVAFFLSKYKKGKVLTALAAANPLPLKVQRELFCGTKPPINVLSAAAGSGHLDASLAWEVAKKARIESYWMWLIQASPAEISDEDLAAEIYSMAIPHGHSGRFLLEALQRRPGVAQFVAQVPNKKLAPMDKTLASHLVREIGIANLLPYGNVKRNSGAHTHRVAVLVRNPFAPLEEVRAYLDVFKADEADGYINAARSFFHRRERDGLDISDYRTLDVQRLGFLGPLVARTRPWEIETFLEAENLTPGIVRSMWDQVQRPHGELFDHSPEFEPWRKASLKFGLKLPREINPAYDDATLENVFLEGGFMLGDSFTAVKEGLNAALSSFGYAQWENFLSLSSNFTGSIKDLIFVSRNI